MYFSSMIFPIIPIIFFIIVGRVIFSLIRGNNRRRPGRDLPGFFGVPGNTLEAEQRAKLPRHVTGNSDEAKIFKLSLKMKGRLTVSDIVIDTGLNIQEAEELIESMVDSVHVRMEVDERGRVVYEFPEIIRRLEEAD